MPISLRSALLSFRSSSKLCVVPRFNWWETVSARVSGTSAEPSSLSFIPKLAGGFSGLAIVMLAGGADNVSACMPKRSRKSAFDAVPEGEYPVEKIVADRMVNGKTQFLVKWVGYDERDNTWEPVTNLAGVTDMIAEYLEAKEKADAEHLAAIRARKAEKANKAQQQAQPSCAGPSTGPSIAGSDTIELDNSSSEEECANVTASKRKAAVWQAYTHGSKTNYYKCKECGSELKHSGGTRSLWNHLLFKHQDLYQNLKGYKDEHVGKDLAAVGGQKLLKAVPFSKSRKEECDLMCARWLIKSSRPLTLPERDIHFREFLSTVVPKEAYSPPCYKNVLDHVLKMSARGQQRVADWVEALTCDRIKPSMAGDIWSDRGCSLLGITLYAISASWKLEELLVAATPFGATRHRGEAIDTLTLEALQACNLKWSASATVYESVFRKVSDNGSNMKKGWSGFEGGFCADHTLELSINAYTEAAGEGKSPCSPAQTMHALSR